MGGLGRRGYRGEWVGESVRRRCGVVVRRFLFVQGLGLEVM